MAKIVKNLVVSIGLFSLGVVAGTQVRTITPEVKPDLTVEVVHTQEKEGTFYHNDISYHLSENETLTILSDGSWALCDNELNNYIFQPVMLGDWDLELKNSMQLENVIKTYIEMNNNL